MVKSLYINDIESLIPNIELIDIRTPEEVATGMIKSAKHIEMMGLTFNADTFLDKDKVYYIYCLSGGRSAMTCMELDKQGYQVVNLEGGIASYTGKLY